MTARDRVPYGTTAPPTADTLVTGASGFVGGSLARRLAEVEGKQVRALVRNPDQPTLIDLRHPNIAMQRGDVRVPETLTAACAGIQVVIHAAMATHLCRRRSLWETAVDGTRNAYQAARAAGVRRFIFISSLAVYFGSHARRYTEETPLRTSGDLYADAKIAAERLLRAAPPGGPEVFILRPAAIYGPASYFWSTRFARIARQNRLFVPGGGHYAMLYLYIDNLIDAISAAITTSTPGGLYNVYDGMMPYRDFVRPYACLAGITPHYMPRWLVWTMAASTEVALGLSGYWAAATHTSVTFHTTRQSRFPRRALHAQHGLGWSPAIEFDEGMRRTQMWLHRQGYT